MLGTEKDAWCPSLSQLHIPFAYYTATIGWGLQTISSNYSNYSNDSIYSNFFSLPKAPFTHMYSNICLCTCPLEPNPDSWCFFPMSSYWIVFLWPKDWYSLVQVRKDALTPALCTSTTLYEWPEDTLRHLPLCKSIQDRLNVHSLTSCHAAEIEKLNQRPARCVPYREWEDQQCASMCGVDKGEKENLKSLSIIDRGWTEYARVERNNLFWVASPSTRHHGEVTAQVAN